jgi:hypothetical protein
VKPIMLAAVVLFCFQTNNSFNWLHPSDLAYTRAIRDGFTGSAKPGPFNEGRDGIHQIIFKFKTRSDERNLLVLNAPLRCAQLMGLDARQNLLDPPTLAEARQTCDGAFVVDVTYTSSQEAESFPITFTFEGSTVRPEENVFRTSPQIHIGRSSSYYVEYLYTYHADFVCRPAQAWQDKVAMRYVIPEEGEPLDSQIDFSVFAGDATSYGAGASPPSR